VLKVPRSVITIDIPKDARLRHLRSCTSDSVPSEARKRGSGGGSGLAPLGPSYEDPPPSAMTY
jgi:hypothetical protein